MADFEIAYKPLRKYEGSYSSNKADRGGETYCGIARNFFPKWKGWEIIDREMNIAGGSVKKMLANLEKTPIRQLVEQWYKAEWWDRLGLARLEQPLANEIFEQSVNLGKAGAGRKLQTICNAYNYNSGERYFTDLVIDGAIGPKTLSALATLTRKKASAQDLVHALNCMQGAHYLELAAKKFSQRTFIRGWMKRTHCEEE